MKNKKLLNIGYLITTIAIALFFIPKVYAAYDCNINYSVAEAISSAELDSCCYPATGEPFGGISCRPENLFLQQIGSVVTCVDEASLKTKATSQKSLNSKMFNCFTGATPNTCRDGYCLLSGACTVQTGYNCPSGSPFRQSICPGGCGACQADYVYCPGNIATDPGICTTLAECNAQNHVCQAKKYGPTGETSESAAGSCKNLGKDVANYCTGECTGCAIGFTESGRTPSACIPFAQRFVEIFKDGLTWLGGWPWDPDNNGTADDFDKDGVAELHAYDYSLTGPVGLASVFLKSDMAEYLNWENPDLPPEIKWLLNNYNLCTVDSDCVKPGYLCSEGGLCYNPNDGAGFACTNNSDCNWLAGFICNASGKCELQTPEVNSTTKFAGLAGITAPGYSTPVNGNRGGYIAANLICDTKYPDSHVCSAKEIVDSYLITAPALAGVTGSAWINNGPPGYIKYVSNDCNGWMEGADTTFFGAIWNFTNKSFKVTTCNLTRQFACCK